MASGEKKMPLLLAHDSNAASAGVGGGRSEDDEDDLAPSLLSEVDSGDGEDGEENADAKRGNSAPVLAVPPM